MFRQGFVGDYFSNIFAFLSEIERIRNREQWGITNENGYDGVSKVNIPHQYTNIVAKDECYYCTTDNLFTLYDSLGKELFTSSSVTYCGFDLYLVQIIDEESVPEDWGYALFKNSKQLTEDIFKPRGSLSTKFNAEGFMAVGLADEWRAKVIINKAGDIIYKDETSDYFSIYGVILKTKKGFLNLLTNSYICLKPHYSSEPFDNGECLFVKTDETCAYQINMKNGSFIIHGKDNDKDKPKTNEEVELLMQQKQERDKKKKKMDDEFNSEMVKWNKLSRNDLCLCGSGKKFKTCCHKNWFNDLRTKIDSKYNG